MFRPLLFLIAAVIGVGAVVWGAIVMAQTEPDSGADTALQLDDNDSNPAHAPQVIIPEAYRSEGTGGSGGTPIYFTPQDENTSVTVLFLYNTRGVTATVNLQTFRLDGSTFISTSVAVPPHHLVRIAADSVSTVSSSWQDVVLVNFTTSSTYARRTVPAGVKFDGYVAWNGGGTYDPLDAVPTLPLRFSIDPPTVFLPAVNGD